MVPFPGILTVSGITNGLFLWTIAERSNQAMVVAGVCFLLAFFISNLCGDYDEKINRIRDTIDYEFRNRSRYHGMREYIEDSDPYYYQEEPAPQPVRRRRPPSRPRYQTPPPRYESRRSRGQSTRNSRPPLRREPPQREVPPEPLYYEEDYQEPQAYVPPQQHYQPQEAYYDDDSDWETESERGQGQDDYPDSFEEVLGDEPPPRQSRQQRSAGGGGGLTNIANLFKHNRKRPF